MNHSPRFVVCLGLAMSLAVPAMAQDKKAQKAAARKAAAIPQVLKLPAEIVLTEEQQTQWKAVQDEFAPKLREINDKLTSLLTDEQKTARTAAAKANKDAGKTGREARAAIDAALKRTDEQKAKWAEIEKERAPLVAKIAEKKQSILTDEQKAKLPKRAGAKKKAGA